MVNELFETNSLKLTQSKSSTNPSTTRHIMLPQYPPNPYHMFYKITTKQHSHGYYLHLQGRPVFKWHRPHVPQIRFTCAEHWRISLQVQETHWCLEGYQPMKFNTLASLLVWIYEYVTYESLILCVYALGSIFDQAFSRICFCLTHWIPTKPLDLIH